MIKDHKGYMTYFEGQSIHEINIQYNPLNGKQEVNDEIMCKIPDTKADVVVDAFAMDDVFLTITQKKKINFFMKPLAAGAVGSKLQFDGKMEDIDDIAAYVVETNHTTKEFTIFAAVPMK